MTTSSRDEAARRAGVEPSYVDRLVELGVLVPAEPGRFTAGDVRRVQLTATLERGGIPLEGFAEAVRTGGISTAFLDSPAYERFTALGSETFLQASDRTGVPLEILMTLREAMGLAPPEPDDRMREDEETVLPFLQLQIEEGFRWPAIERLLRVYGDSARRIGEQEGAWWLSEVAGRSAELDPGEDIGRPELAARTAPLAERSFLAIYHSWQARQWTANIIEGFERTLDAAGIHSRLERVPAICFLDITGYTRLTQEQGDDAAAELASTVARLVQRSSLQHGGKPIKWLGDGVMFLFPEPGRGVRAALEMVDGIAAAGLPPAHVGLHAGPVLFQEGDYFGQTVNLSARIADYARPGEVLVSQAVVDASGDDGLAFSRIGPVELKGVSAPIELLRAELDRRS
ncbi:MAG: adenylate/guanylate cyclase domain-containing protein [Actinomycetota bacterium]